MVIISKHFTVAFTLLPLCMALLSGVTAEASGKKPNFIVILTDDLGYGDFACYGAEKIKTPNIDRMAEEGTMFESFYVSSVCTPTRASLMTGCYPMRVGLPGVMFQRSGTGLSHDEITLPELLKEQGYATAIIGKWHLGFRSSQNPLHHGFDYWMGTYSSNNMKYHIYDQAFAPDCVFRDGYTAESAKAAAVPCPLLRNNKMIEVPADQTQFTKRYTEETLEFIKKTTHSAGSGQASQPFFIYLAHNMPHIPLYASEKFKGKSQYGLYGDVIEELDWGIGEVLKGIREMGLDENTFVILTSDNGPQKGAGGLSGPLKGGKGTKYEGGVRVPAIMRWPGKVPAGVLNKQPIAVFDLLPTLVNLAGGSVPADRIIDGRDVWPLIADGGKTKTPHQAIFHGAESVRVDEWKLVYAKKLVNKQDYQLTKEERKLPPDERKKLINKKKNAAKGKPVLSLFNLNEDIGENTNLIEQHPEIAQRLQKMMDAFKVDMKQNKRREERLPVKK